VAAGRGRRGVAALLRDRGTVCWLREALQRPERAAFGSESGGFSLVLGTPTEHAHLAFAAADDATVDAFHRAAVDAGYRDNGAPGERPVYHAGYYGAYVLDPDGNNVELVNHNRGA
jgi:catechol 2,3-dioxygenase-like lactoylglutathione lyase family enzyme